MFEPWCVHNPDLVNSSFRLQKTRKMAAMCSRPMCQRSATPHFPKGSSCCLGDMLSSRSNSNIATNGNSGSFSESLLFVLSYGLGGLCRLCQPTFKPCRLAKHVHREVSKCSKNQWQLRNLAFGLTLASFDLCRSVGHCRPAGILHFGFPKASRKSSCFCNKPHSQH